MQHVNHLFAANVEFSRLSVDSLIPWALTVDDRNGTPPKPFDLGWGRFTY